MAGAQAAWSARTVPLIIASAGCLVSLLLLFSGNDAKTEWSGDWSRALRLCAFTALYALALPRFGFFAATMAFLAIGFRTLGERRPRVLLAVPASVALVLLVLLRVALGVYLPEPLLEMLARR